MISRATHEDRLRIVEAICQQISGTGSRLSTSRKAMIAWNRLGTRPYRLNKYFDGRVVSFSIE